MREGSEQYCTWVINVWSFAAHGLTRRNYVTTNAALMEQLEEEKGKRPQVEYLEHDDELVCEEDQQIRLICDYERKKKAATNKFFAKTWKQKKTVLGE